MAYKLINGAPPSVKVVEVIIVERGEGEGSEREPVRVVRYIHTLEGRLIGKFDELADEGLRRWSPPSLEGRLNFDDEEGL